MQKVNRGGKTAVVPLLVILLLGVYVILLLRFEYSDFIYSGRYSILGDCNVSETLKEDAFRFLIGIAGSMMVISIIHLAIECCVLKGGALQLMSAIGKETLGIYVFQDLCFSLISPWLGKLDSHYAVINVLISFPIIFILSYQLTKWAKQSPIAGQLFLGRKV